MENYNMKIKKYQNPSGILSPEREAEIRAEQQAALDDLWRQRNAYAEQEEQERKQQLKEEIKRVTAEHAAKTAHLDNGSSATDWYYALQDDPQKRAEWDRGAKLTTLAGIGAVATPYLLYGMGSMGGAIYKGLNNPITRTAVQQAGTKAGISTLFGEAISQASYATGDAFNRSSIGKTRLNESFLQPMFSTVLPIVLDPDRAIEKRLSTGVVDMAGDILQASNIPVGQRTHQQLGRKLKNTITDLAQKDNEILLETFPARPEYFSGLDPNARTLYENAISRGDGLIGNGTYLGMSGEEIARRELGKAAGFGNDGVVLLRASGPNEFVSPSKVDTYTFAATPGIADKYAISIDKGTTFPGYFTEGGLKTFESMLGKIDDRIELVSRELDAAIASNNRQKITECLRELETLYRRRPSDIQVYNARSGVLPKFEPDVDLAAALGENLRTQMMQKVGGSNAIRHGDIGLDLGLEKTISNTTGSNLIEPLIYKDGIDILQIPNITNVNQKGAMKLDKYFEQLFELYPHLRSVLTQRAKDMGYKVIYPDTFAKMLRNSKDPELYMDSALAHAFMGRVADSTLGLGPVTTMTFVGQSPGLVKGIGPLSSGQFLNTPSILKNGGYIPKYFKLLKRK